MGLGAFGDLGGLLDEADDGPAEAAAGVCVGRLLLDGEDIAADFDLVTEVKDAIKVQVHLYRPHFE